MDKWGLNNKRGYSVKVFIVAPELVFLSYTPV